MSVRTFVDELAALMGVVPHDFHEFLEMPDPLHQLFPDPPWVFHVATVGIHEPGEGTILWLFQKLSGLAFEVGDLLFEHPAVNPQLFLARLCQVARLLAEPLHFDLQHVAQVTALVGGIEPLHPHFLVFLQQRIGLKVRMQRLGQLFEKRLEIPLLRLLLLDKFPLFFQLRFRLLARLDGPFPAKRIVQPFLQVPLELFRISLKIQILQIQLDPRFFGDFFRHGPQKIELIALRLSHLALRFARTDFLDQPFQSLHFLPADANGIRQKIRSLAAEQIAKPAPPFRSQFHRLQCLLPGKNEIPAEAVRLLNQRHQLADRQLQSTVQARLLACVLRPRILKTFHQPVELDLRRAQRRLSASSNQQSLVARAARSGGFFRPLTAGRHREGVCKVTI